MQLSITTAYRIILASVGLVLCLVLSIEAATAQTNPQINYQGKLTTSSGVAVPNGTYNMRFWLLSGPSVATSSALWTESLTTTSRVQVTNGLFSVMLGSTTPLTSVDWNQTLYLAVEIGGTSTTPVWDGEMSPRKVIGTVPAAFEARRLEGVASSSFLRSDEADTMAATTSGTLLSVIQNGAGAIARFFSGVTEVFTIAGNGNVGVGTSTPSQAFTVVGNTRITGALFDGNNASGTSGMILQTTGTTTRWVATSTLGYLSGGSSLSDLGDVTITTPGSGQLLSYNGSQWVNVATSSLGLGGVTFSNSSQLAALLSDETGTGAAVFGTGATLASTTLTGTTYLSGNVGIGTTSPNSLLALERSSVSGTTTALFDFNLGLANSSVGAVQYGGLTNIVTTNTATTSIVGNLLRITDSTSYGNTVRGLEVQTNRGTNTFGENTAISGFGRTFGVRGTTEGDAGSVLEPAGIYGVTRGTTQGNAIRGYSSSITTASLLSLFQDTSAFAGTGLLMNFGNTSGSFSSSTSKFLDLQVAGVSRFTINASGSVTIGDGVNDAGLTVRGSATTTNLRVTGAFRDSVNSAGTSGMVLQSTGTSTRWVATSSLGVGSGGATVIDDLSDVVITTPATGNTLVYNGANWVNQATSTLGFLANASIDTSSELAAILGDETGTGSVVFSANPTFTGTATFANLFGTTATITSATSTNLAATRLNMAGDSITDFTGTGLTVTGNALTVSTSTLGLAAGFFAQSGNSFGAAAVLGTNDNNVLQFETNGTVNMTLATSGNLGIGTTSPTARLAIDTSSLGSTPALMIASSTGRVSLMVANNGFVGMGTKNPQYPFHFSDSGFNNNAFFENLTSHSGISIKSAGGFASYISFDSDGNGTGLFGLKGSGNDPAASDLGYHFLQSGGINDPSIMTLNRVSNNLGLGTTTPQNRITVIGYNNYPLLDLASSSGQSLLRVAANGSLGLGTTSPSARLTIAGDLRLTGRFADASSSTGSVGQVLMATATGTQWVSTSTLGFGTGGSGTVYLASTSPWTTNDLAQVVSNGTLRSIATSSLGLFGVTGNSIASAQLLASLSDETGTGSVVFSANSTFTGTATFANLFGTTATITSATSTNLGLTRLNMNGDSITDFSGTGLQVVNNNLTVATSTLGLVGGGGAANRVAYFSDASTLTTSANFTYDGTNFGLGGTNGIAFGGTRFITASSGNDSITFGEGAGAAFSTTTTFNIAIGAFAGNNSTASTSDSNIFLGSSAGRNSSNDLNIFIGGSAGRDNTGRLNTFIGNNAGDNNTGNTNIGIGDTAGFDNTGRENIFLGISAGTSNSGSYNNFIGSSAGAANNGNYNDFIGYFAGSGLKATATVLVGAESFGLTGNFSAVNNTAIGYRAGYAAQTGASNNVLLGYQAADNLTTGANNIVIGYDVDIASTTGSNQLNIGNLLFGTGINGTSTTLSTGNIGIGTTSPSARLTIAGVAGQDMLRIASSTGSTTLALLANGNLELSGQLVSAGVSWNTLAPLPVSYDWFGVTYGAGRYVAVGNGAVMYSSDALNWSTTTAAGNNDVWISVTYGNGRFVAVGSNGDRVMYSDDGITWATTTAAGNNDGWRDVTYGNGRFVAVGGGATDRTMYSDDGVNWTSVSAVGNNDTWNDVTYGNNRFVAVGDVGDRVMYSTDGVTWLTPATSTAADKNDGWNGVTYGDGRFVAVGDSGDRVMYSTDGITWTVTGAGLSGGFQDVEYGEGIFVAVGDAGWPEQIITSSDGINWTVRDGNFASFGLGGYYKLTYGNGRFVGIGDYAGYNVLYSGKLNESLPFASNALQGNWSVMSRFGVGTTSRAASLFVQAQSGVTPFTVASSTGANLFSVTGAGSLALDGSSAIGNGNIFSGVTSLTSTSTLTKYSTVFGESSLAGATRLRYSSIYGDSNSFTGNAVGNSSMSYSSIYGNSNAFSNGSYLYTSALYGTSNTFAADAYLNDSSLFGTTNSFGLYGTLDLSHLSGDNNTLRDYAVLDRSVVYGSSNIFATSSTVTNTAIFGNSNTASGTVSSAFVFGNSNSITSASNVFAVGNSLGTLRSNFATFYNLLNIDNASGSVGIGTTTSSSRLALRNTGITGTTSEALLLDQYLGLANVSAGAVQIGNRFNLVTTNTATTTIVGSIFRIQDSTTYGNTLRGLEVQAQRGTNTLGENTALSGFARTFGVRGTTEGDAGAIFEPAGVYGETRGTTQGNAIRGYSSTITTASLLSLFQDSSTFAGTGLSMNFGNAGGSFSSTSSRFLDFRVSGTSRFVVNASGTVTIGDGTNAAGLQIGRGGLCVDSDGSCNASTSGHITAVAYATNNSDLAENYFSNDGLLAGEIVALSGGLSVDRAEVENATAVIGVVSTAPGLTLGADDSSLRPGEQPYPIALSGRVPIRLSNENGPVRKGDQIMLSSVPGIGMKATGTGLVIGVALEDFDAERAYSETYISQFGENLITPEYPPFVPNDPRINDGCYYGGGAESGAAPCVPLQATTTDGQQQEAERLAAIEAKERALRNLARTPSEERTLADGRRVLVGQITMFVDRGYRYLTTEQEVALAALMSTSTGAYEAVNADEPTLFDRMAMLASSFVDGVLSIFRLETEEVQTDKLCVGTTCVDEETLRRLLESDSGAGAGNTPAPVVAPPVTEPEYVPPVSGPLPNEPGPTDDPPAPEVVPSGDGGGASAETTEEPPPAENEEPSVPNTTETEPSEPPAAEVLLDEVTQTPPTNPEITP